MNAKTFYDGNRLVFVIENCTDEVKESLFTLLQPEVVDNIDAQQGQPFGVNNHQNNEQVGMDDIDRALASIQQSQPNNATDKDFKFISKMYQAGKIPQEKGDVRGLLNFYVGNRFKGKNPDDLIPKLTAKQCESFVDTFDLVFAKVWEKFNVLNPEEFVNYTLDVQQNIVKAGIEQCIHIGEILEKQASQK